MVFRLVSTPSTPDPVQTVTVTCPLYQNALCEATVTNPFPVPVEFAVSISNVKDKDKVACRPAARGRGAVGRIQTRLGSPPPSHSPAPSSSCHHSFLSTALTPVPL